MSAGPAAATGRRLSWDALLLRGRPGFLELLVAGGALLLVGILVYLPHITGGGFIYDDWANAAYSHYSGDGSYWDALDTYAKLTAYRPALIPYVPLTHVVLGTHYGWHLAWAVVLAAAMSAGLYQLLREVSVERVHAFAIAALVMVFPASDAVRLWPTASMATLAVALLLFGAVLALVALRSEGWRKPVLHVASLALYLLSVATYELGAPLIFLFGLLYLWKGERREALIRWGADIVALLLLLGLVTAGHQSALTFSEMLDHARMIVDQGLGVIAGAAVPFGAPSEAFVIFVMLAVIAVGALLWRLLPDDEAARGSFHRWLILAAAGLVAAGAGWVLLVPADVYYSPQSPGIANRVNTVAAMGVVLLVYSVVMLVATTAFRGVPRGAALTTGLAVLAALVIGWGYVDKTRADIDVWNAAWNSQQQVRDFLGSELPDPADGTVIFLFGAPAFQAPGVPVFAAQWDLNGMTKMYYRNPTIGGLPAIKGVTCTPEGVVATDLGAGPVPYGAATFADVATREIVTVGSRRRCEALAGRFQPGPFQLTG